MKKRLRYIYLAFGLSFSIIITIAILFYAKFNSILEVSKEVEHAYQVKNLILRIQSYLVEAESNQRGYLITEDKELLVPLTQTQKSIFAEIEKLGSLTTDNKEQQQIVKRLKQIVSLRYQVLYETIDNASNVQLPLFLKSAKRGRVVMQQFRELSGEMDLVESRVLEEKMRSKNALELAAPKYLLLILFISFFFQIASVLILVQANKRRRQYQSILENKVSELNNNNLEFEQIAFVASHDLQEPLRKIRTYSDKLIKQQKGSITDDGQVLLDKIAVASKRMQELLNDLINYIRLSKNEENLQQIDLNLLITSVCNNLSNTIDLKKATVSFLNLPIINGYYKQLYLLFYNLLENSLKFSKQLVEPVINITATITNNSQSADSDNFIKITFSDNGIGFEKEFAQKIFIIFQRLHTQSSPYLGKGIGLAICKRVMLNHKGFITADGQIEEGASFDLYFPNNKNQQD